MCCTGVYKPSYDQLNKKIHTQAGLMIPILICQILTPIINKKKNKINTAMNTNQKTPNLESLTLYFIINILFVLVLITIQLANG